MAERLTWVGGNDCAVDAEIWLLGMDEDGFLFAVACIEEFEERYEQRVAQIMALVVGQKDGANGTKLRAGVFNLCDTRGM